MGGCHSHPSAAANVPTKPPVECAKQDGMGIEPESVTTGTTRDSSEVTDAHHHHIVAEPTEPIPEDNVPSIIPIQENAPIAIQPAGKRGHYKRKSNSVNIKKYLQADASCNRVMVHIETPFGLPIESVYSGVHDGYVLGEGIAGKVRLINHIDTGIQRAVKRLDLSLVTSDADLDRLVDEIRIMCCLDHPNVVTLEEVYEGENELFLTQELCLGGDLFDRLDEQPNYCYTEAGCARLMKQIISSVSYLHSKDIVHRDLKLENFLFMDRGAESELKMIDFGLSKHFTPGEVQHESVGTPYSVAPEVILGKGYDEKCDVWGIGVIAYLLLSGETPFGGACEGEDLTEVRENIIRGEVSFDGPCWNVVSADAIDFIKSMLVLDPEKRPSSLELQNQQWLKKQKRNSSLGSDESNLSNDVVNGLVSFKSLSSTRKFLREIISYTLQPSQIAGLHEEFDKFDVEGTGEISLHCFKEVLLASSDQHPLSEDEIEEIFAGLRVRGTDMSIRWHEFIAACLSQCQIDERNIRLAFERLDPERKGYITLNDLKSAMSFYGSDSGNDLQATWITNIADYKTDKDTMTYDDFYKLLKLEKGRSRESTPRISLSKSAPPHLRSAMKRRGNALTRSYMNMATSLPDGIDQKASEMLCSSLVTPGPSNQGNDWIKCRRHSLGPVYDLDLEKIIIEDQEPSVVASVKQKRDIHDFILEASKRVEDKRFEYEKKKVVSHNSSDEEKKQGFKSTRRISVTGKKGLFIRRDSQDPDRLHLVQ